MKNGYYLYTENCGSCGVMNKIKMQIDTFSQQLIISGVRINNVSQNFIQRVINVSIWGSIKRDYASTLQKMKNPDYIYMRLTYADRQLMFFLKNIKTKYPKCKVIIEIPSFPYDKEWCSSWYTLLLLPKELLYRKQYKRYIDRFVTYSDDKSIFGVPTIKTMNGINTKKNVMPGCIKGYNKNEINLVAIAFFTRRHGYERIIEGLSDYYQNVNKRTVVLHLVGTGEEVIRYKKLVNRFKLEKYVIFHGEKRDDELECIYEIADIGLAAFGMYKDGLEKISTIKAREYVAHGIPVALGAADRLFDDSPFGLLFENNSEKVDIQRIIDYLDLLYIPEGKMEVSKKIRDFAEKNVDNSVTLRPIIEYIMSEEL